MRTVLLALAFCGTAGAALAGGMATPVTDEAVIVEDSGSSGGDNWAGVALLVLLLVAAAD